MPSTMEHPRETMHPINMVSKSLLTQYQEKNGVLCKFSGVKARHFGGASRLLSSTRSLEKIPNIQHSVQESSRN